MLYLLDLKLHCMVISADGCYTLVSEIVNLYEPRLVTERI